MERTTYGPEVAEFVSELLAMPRGFGPCTAIGFRGKFAELEAGVVYHNWCPENGTIEISSAALHHRWGTKERLRIIFNYPFGFVRMVVARTSENNPTPLRIWRALGAKEYRIPDLRGPGEAEIVTTLTADQWKDSRWAR
jgi:hypothetical protein